MLLIRIESLSKKELEHIAVQEGVRDASDLSREELIDTLKEIYEVEQDDDPSKGEANIQRRFVTWLTDYRGDGSEVTSLPGVEALPELYSETSIHVLTKNATWLYCYWSVSPLDAEKFDQKWPGWSLLLDVRLSDGGVEYDSFDIAVSPSDNEWNISVNKGHGEARVHLVVEAPDGSREVIASSQVVTLVSCYWLEHPEMVASSVDLLRRELSLITNKEGQVIPCETVQEIVQEIRKEEGL